MRGWLALTSVLLLAACARPIFDAPDGPPDGAFDPSRIQKPEPRAEPRSAYGNHTPYEVLGRTYHVLPSAEGYSERGIASWYGTRFHGRATSSGEPYDLYQLTAAHRTLPLPTYARVLHLGNGRSIIVRINDRGPFHPDRIIDLSWAAAVKLGIDQVGTAEVEVTAISFDDPIERLVRPASVPVMLQVGAFSERERADRTIESLRRAGISPLHSERARSNGMRVWRVQVGPISEVGEALAMVERLTALGFEPPRYVYP
ncbi:MAG: septal ring lytic transglycosylase RlpA family protein [Wenzhouxiangella sp.]|jgi:rare lipoprotein A|nr:septal ring lytic transglycosylase RlpA family protein [Wenzhouxiangella sp.]